MLEDPIKISKDLTVGAQPDEEEFAKLAKQGFRSVVNLSTMGELGQKKNLNPEEEGKLVEELGMQYVHFPVSLSRLKNVELSEFFAAIRDLPRPIFMHCRIGQRAVPFGLLVYAEKRELGYTGLVDRGEKLGISLDIPSVSSFIKKGIAACQKAVEADSATVH